jgi:alkaline phosphatase D
MRIAFTSCFSAELFPDQPVWDEIAKANPDVLVLLGDSMYLDVGLDAAYNTAALQQMATGVFSAHVHKRFQQVLAQPRFSALVRTTTVSTYAIWDDHDFLWNDACGADVMKNPALRPLLYPSRAGFAAFRKALAQRLAPGSYPATPAPYDNNTPAPGHTCVDLGMNVFLHLTDGRSFRKGRGKKALLGEEQLNALEAAMKAAPAGATHLVASGSVYDARHGDSWLNCPPEYSRMQQLAQNYNILFLSGDIHDNNLASYVVPGGRNLFEATASGAALRTGVIIGAAQRNYGMLTIDDTNVGIDLVKSGKSQYRGTVHRGNWA